MGCTAGHLQNVRYRSYRCHCDSASLASHQYGLILDKDRKKQLDHLHSSVRLAFMLASIEAILEPFWPVAAWQSLW